ncbi:hypothetical protein CY0110_17887 [Crocosphaera chwakensis CCY0110]|uniref:Uncharacterized protein n=1 Tax=Crocosphaera chwakensis CCY0110 TaxID=391612 RepID=A3IIQ9_9CHRO|nr:hypothetical protein CY0110_17887 [Crocosphaera chwakensis CCY0110]
MAFLLNFLGSGLFFGYGFFLGFGDSFCCQLLRFCLGLGHNVLRLLTSVCQLLLVLGSEFFSFG